MIETFDDFDLESIKLASFISYLGYAGWEQADYDDKRTLVFIKPDEQSDRPFIIVLPQDEHIRDYAVRIEEAIARLATVEDIPFDAAVREIRSVGQDVIYLRMALVKNEYPSLENASHLVKGVRDLVVWGACMEREPQRYFHQISRVAHEQTEHFRFAHTYKGSFGIAIESDIPEIRQGLLWEGNEELPPARRVLERITRGFIFTQRAERSDNAAEIIENFTQGFNGNMCRAVVEMLESIREGNITYDVHWSAHCGVSKDVATFDPVILSARTTSYLKKAAAYLEKNDQQDSSGETVITGKVMKMSYDVHGQGEVTVSDASVGQIVFTLDDKAYRMAGNAHLSRQIVTVTGKLATRGTGQRNRFTLLYPHNLEVLGEKL